MNKAAKYFSIERIVILLLFLVIISFYLMTSLYAKYTAGASPSALARTAAFSVTGTSYGDNITVESISPPYSSDYLFSITSESEVAVKYDVTVSFAETIPSWITLLLDGVAGTQSGNTATFLNVGTFEAGTHTDDHTLTFRADPSASSVTTFSSINVRVDAVQID